MWQLDETNGHPNGYADDADLHCVGIEKRKGEVERVDMLKKEVVELKEVIEGKDFVLQSYKEHNSAQRSGICRNSSQHKCQSFYRTYE